MLQNPSPDTLLIAVLLIVLMLLFILTTANLVNIQADANSADEDLAVLGFFRP